MKTRRLPKSFYNPITLTGAAIAVISFILILFLTAIELFSSENNPYLGIITFIILPSILIMGLILIAFGAVREHKREKEGKERELPVINLNDPKQRTAVSIFIFGTIILLLFTAFGSYKAYEYSETDEFCGTVCHKVMEPEYTAYRFSPHARVGCVKCHIGPGAGWFVRSKLSGAYQVYSVLFNKYSRPIPTPIHNLRPAQETCEQCHWPKHFYSKKEHENNYYISDENNTWWSLTLLMNIGGGYEESGVTSGIHWHMNIYNEVTYVATDSSRMVIPWVKVKSLDGKETIYKSIENRLSDEELKKGISRKMDCIDCHNRPSHIYHHPADPINHLLSTGDIDPDLPYIKSVGMKVLERSYRTKSIALDSIKLFIEDFYQVSYPEIATSKKDNINNAISELQKIYSRNYFPEMNVSWKHYPNQIGHMYAPGCFRCHDGKHVSDDGKILTRDCNVCHTLLAQEYEGAEAQLSLQGVDYIHPVDIGKAWKSMMCSDCHTKNR